MEEGSAPMHVVQLRGPTRRSPTAYRPPFGRFVARPQLLTRL
jgi:hypothetical protein